MLANIWKQYKKSKIGLLALATFIVFFVVGVYAPLLASSKPLLIEWNGTYYSPLLRYLFYPGYYTKPIDLFFNLLMITLPIAMLGFFLKQRVKKLYFFASALLHMILFGWIVSGGIKDPSNNVHLEKKLTQAKLEQSRTHEDPLLAPLPTHLGWHFDRKYLTPYGELNLLIAYRQMLAQHLRLAPYAEIYSSKKGRELPSLWQVWQRNEAEKRAQLDQLITTSKQMYHEAQHNLTALIEAYRPFSHRFIMAKYALKHANSNEEKQEAKETLDHVIKEAAHLRLPLENARALITAHNKLVADFNYLEDKKTWLDEENKKFHILFPPLLRFFHWEEDAGGSQEANQYLPWWELTRINRKDLIASLLFGIRISIVVGITAVALSLLIGIPLGALAGYFAGKTDLLICRMIEVWEAMPTFFMLLLIVAIAQSKSIFLVVGVLGIFGWTAMARYIRSEVLKQRKLSYVMACHCLGFSHWRIMFSHILPNAIPPILTLLPFSMMAAVTSEAGLSFLGLGEEGSTSWGVLMDEGRSVFPAESYLLWPPALLLTGLLIAIALIGDRLRDAIDPKMR